MRVAFATLGCKVNHYETQAMRELFETAGWQAVPFSGPAEVYIVNTCTVTAVSDAKSRQMIARAHALNPSALIAAVGCYAQADAEALAALPGVGLVAGTDGRANIVTLVDRALLQGGMDAGNPAHASCFEPISALRGGRTRATLKIQDGCTNYCSYCIIPYVRGPLRSRPLADVEAELHALVAAGYREVVLAGIHLASYGRDIGDVTLLDVLQAADGIDGLERIRLGSLEPGFVDKDFADFAAKSRMLCDQFHLSLQSGSPAVLTRMKRRYTPDEFSRSVALLREARPLCAVTTDLIAGFPGETEAEHEESLDFCRRMDFSRMHVFPYSPRPGTAAAAMPDPVPKAVRDARAKTLIACGKALSQRYLTAQIGRELSVLVERSGVGYAANYVLVKVGGRPGDIRHVRVTGLDGDILIGEEVPQTTYLRPGADIISNIHEYME